MTLSGDSSFQIESNARVWTKFIDGVDSTLAMFIMLLGRIKIYVKLATGWWNSRYRFVYIQFELGQNYESFIFNRNVNGENMPYTYQKEKNDVYDEII